MKQILLSAIIFVFLVSPNAQAEDAFQDFFNYCTYGVVTGMLIGGASLAIAEDPGSNISPITKGASLGLYAGALVSVYKNWYGPRHSRIELGQNQIDESKPKNSLPDFLVIPQTQGMSFALKWEL